MQFADLRMERSVRVTEPLYASLAPRAASRPSVMATLRTPGRASASSACRAASRRAVSVGMLTDFTAAVIAVALTCDS